MNTPGSHVLSADLTVPPGVKVPLWRAKVGKSPWVCHLNASASFQEVFQSPFRGLLPPPPSQDTTFTGKEYVNWFLIVTLGENAHSR